MLLDRIWWIQKLKPLQDQTLAETAYADDITRLFKAWETDMGSVANMGYPEVAKACDERCIQKEKMSSQ